MDRTARDRCGCRALPWLLSGVAALTFGSAGPASATILLFQTEPPIVTGVAVPTSYGNRVSSSSRVESDGLTWLYDEGTSFTPHAQIGYAVRSAPGSSGAILANVLDAFASSGDLGVAAYAPVPFSTSTAEVTLSPDPGFELTLNSFDLVGFQGVTYLNQPVQVYDANYNLLTDFGGPQTIGSPHSHFSPGVTSSSAVHLQYGDNFDVGINNINFDEQAVPEPATILLAVCGIALVGAARIRPANSLTGELSMGRSRSLAAPR